MLTARILAAAVFAPTLLGIVWLGDLPLQITCGALTLLMMWEFQRMTLGDGDRSAKIFGYLSTALVSLSVLGVLPSAFVGLVPPALIMGLLIVMLLRPEPIAGAASRAGYVALGIAYCGGLLPFLYRLRELGGEMGLGMALAALFCTWGADTGAYVAGRAFGKHKLYPAVSPAKTVEGAMGGIAVSVAVAFTIRQLFGLPTEILSTLGVGVIAAIFGIIGDLAESLFKRSTGVKDSSRLIPGHGGVLDRFDAVMFAAPALFVYLSILQSDA